MYMYTSLFSHFTFTACNIRMVRLQLILALTFSYVYFAECFFQKLNWIDGIRTNQKNYGVAVSDVNFDGKPDFIVAGYSGSNFVFSYNPSTGQAENLVDQNPYQALGDRPGNAIGVTACDVDGDGKEEIYFLNTNQAYAGVAAYGDKLFKWRGGRYVDLFSDDINRNLQAQPLAGRSVACVDRNGTGIYSIVVATYSYRGQGKFALIEMDDNHPNNNVATGQIVLKNAAEDANIARSTGGRGIVVGPILGNNGRSDVFFGNEGNSNMYNAGANYLFMNLPNGTFTDMAGVMGIADANENVRGIALADFNRDGKIDITYGNWMGPHRLFLHQGQGTSSRFSNVANSEFSSSTPIRTVMAADFDNDGELEVVHNNIYYRGQQPNKLFRVTPDGAGVRIARLDMGAAIEPEGYGTGGAYTDFDGDGMLDMMLSHGEGNSQPITIFKAVSGGNNNWIRVQPKTLYGAPARGAAVKVTTNRGISRLFVIDGGSGYLCEMEPYAHIGLGNEIPTELSVMWPDGRSVTNPLSATDINKVHSIEHPDNNGGTNQSVDRSTDCPIDSWKATPYRSIPVLCEGDRVTRGPGWTWSNENNNRPGTVIDSRGSSYINYYEGQGDPYWVLVRWDHNGVTLPYRMGSRGVQDLCRCSDCNVRPECTCSC